MFTNIKRLCCAAACVIMLSVSGLCAVAAEENDGLVGTMQTLSVDVDVKETADGDSAVLGSLDAGTAVIVESQDGEWCKVFYQDLEGYVPATALEAFAIEDAEELETQMNNVAEEEQRIVEHYSDSENQKKYGVGLGIVVVCLVLGIFAASIYSTKKSEQKDEQKEEQKKEQE